MASRILARRLSALGSSRRASSPQYTVPLYDMFPLGRGSSLLGLRDIVDDVFGSVSKLEGQHLRGNSRAAWDVVEDEKAFKLRLDMPGLSKEEVKVDVEEGNLMIKGEKKPGTEDDWSRRSTGSYNIKIKLPDNVRVDAIKAELKNGVLRITSPKMDETKKRVTVSID
ncbi:hypothetical protein GOP47_0002925 [Adiantum capillus-veneris]|uniref:SHSP domain-containing protein n=1 Tax=Adiantum capillus-veneris TaxID=13818 RepID=A0A9D4ZRR9_ADICA|nr:hypothetical protein GOP47_0002925 [Adiantum capillus-veneris]